ARRGARRVAARGLLDRRRSLCAAALVGGRGRPVAGGRRRCARRAASSGRAVGRVCAGDLGSVSGAREQRLGGRDHHRHVATFLGGVLLDDGEARQFLGEPVEDRGAALGVGDLAPAEHDRDLDLVLVAQEALYVSLLGVVVVRGDLGTELDLAHGDLLLVLARLLLLLRLLVLV